jgi:hypothetical protein
MSRDDDRPRRRRPQEEDDYRDGPPGKASNNVLWITPAILAALVVGAVFLFAASRAVHKVQVAAERAEVERAEAEARAGVEVRDREDLKALVMGKTMGEVKGMLGGPDTTSAPAQLGLSTVWYYKGITTDPATGKIAKQVQIVFRKGVVTVVEY